MDKIKIYLFLFIIPLSFLFYHITSFEFGVNAFLAKKKEIKKLNLEKAKIEENIYKLSHKIELLNSKNPDKDLLEEKSFEILGNAEKNTYHIIINNL